MPDAKQPALERCPQTITILSTKHRCLLAAGHDGNHHFEIAGKKPASTFDLPADGKHIRPTRR